MNTATLSAQLVAQPSLNGRAGPRLLAALLAIESAAALAAAVGLSEVAQGAVAEVGVRFVAAGAMVVAVAAYVAFRAVRRRRTWSYATAAALQIVVALGVSALAQGTGWHLIHLVGVGIAAAIMLALSLASVRSALGQG